MVQSGDPSDCISVHRYISGPLWVRSVNLCSSCVDCYPCFGVHLAEVDLEGLWMGQLDSSP